MQQFLGVKHINAKPMNRGDYNTLRGWTLPSDENPDDEGFLVEYLNSPTTGMPDGFTNYISWSPKEVFEDSYRTTDGLSFGLAVEVMKEGKRVARKGWDGMFTYLVPANSYPAQTGAAKEHFGENAMVPYRQYMALKTAQEDVATWHPSGSDALADDWFILHD